MNDEDRIRVKQLDRTKGAGYVDQEIFERDVERMIVRLQMNGEPFERDDALKALLNVYGNPLLHRYWNADAADDGTPRGRVMRLLYRLQVSLQEQGDEEAHDFLCDNILDIATDWHRSPAERRLRSAVEAELTHGGIIDEIAQNTTTIGAWASGQVDAHAVERIRQAAQRLDTARNEFITRMEEALK